MSRAESTTSKGAQSPVSLSTNGSGIERSPFESFGLHSVTTCKGQYVVQLSNNGDAIDVPHGRKLTYEHFTHEGLKSCLRSDEIMARTMLLGAHAHQDPQVRKNLSKRLLSAEPHQAAQVRDHLVELLLGDHPDQADRVREHLLREPSPSWSPELMTRARKCFTHVGPERGARVLGTVKHIWLPLYDKARAGERSYHALFIMDSYLSLYEGTAAWACFAAAGALLATCTPLLAFGLIVGICVVGFALRHLARHEIDDSGGESRRYAIPIDKGLLGGGAFMLSGRLAVAAGALPVAGVVIGVITGLWLSRNVTSCVLQPFWHRFSLSTSEEAL